MLNCREATRLISQSMDAKLPWPRRLAMRDGAIVGAPSTQELAAVGAVNEPEA